MHHRAVNRLAWSLLWVCAASSLLFGALKHDLERESDGEDDSSAAVLFAEYCGACHQATDLDLRRYDDDDLLRFLDTHSRAGPAEGRVIVDWLTGPPIEADGGSASMLRPQEPGPGMGGRGCPDSCGETMLSDRLYLR